MTKPDSLILNNTLQQFVSDHSQFSYQTHRIANYLLENHRHHLNDPIGNVATFLFIGSPKSRAVRLAIRGIAIDQCCVAQGHCLSGKELKHVKPHQAQTLQSFIACANHRPNVTIEVDLSNLTSKDIKTLCHSIRGGKYVNDVGDSVNIMHDCIILVAPKPSFVRPSLDFVSKYATVKYDFTQDDKPAGHDTKHPATDWNAYFISGELYDRLTMEDQNPASGGLCMRIAKTLAKDDPHGRVPQNSFYMTGSMKRIRTFAQDIDNTLYELWADHGDMDVSYRPYCVVKSLPELLSCATLDSIRVIVIPLDYFTTGLAAKHVSNILMDGQTKYKDYIYSYDGDTFIIVPSKFLPKVQNQLFKDRTSDAIDLGSDEVSQWTGLTYQQAIKAIHKGHAVRRPSWPCYWFIPDEIHLEYHGETVQLSNHPILARRPGGTVIIPTHATTNDKLAHDWRVVNFKD